MTYKKAIRYAIHYLALDYAPKEVITTLQNAVKELDKLDKCPNDIDDNAMVLCEDFDIADDVCRDCWEMNGGRK